MFERFTDRGRRVICLAQEEARQLGHNYIGTEHVLLGLIHEDEGVAARALKSLGISLEGVRDLVQEIIGRGQAAPTGHIPFTPRAKRVLELSLREALQFGHNYVGTEHLLLGLIREGEGVGAQVLVKLGAELTQARKQVIKTLSDDDGHRVDEKLRREAAQACTAEVEPGGHEVAGRSIPSGLKITFANSEIELDYDSLEINQRAGELTLKATWAEAPKAPEFAGPTGTLLDGAIWEVGDA